MRDPSHSSGALPPRTRRERRQRARERLVLAAGLGSAAALAGVALLAFRSSSAASELVAARLAGELADEVRAEWERVLAAPDEPAPPLGARFRWRVADAAERAAPDGGLEARDVLAADDPAQPSALALLLREAERLEIAGAPGEALALLDDALARNPTSPLRPEAFLRAIQLARRADDSARVRTLWRAAWSETGFAAARGETAYALYCTFAAAPALEERERAEAQRALADAWARGELALPRDPARVEIAADGTRSVVEAPARAVLAERLAALANDDVARALLAEDARARTVAALRDALGELPLPGEDAGWLARAARDGVFLARRVSAHECEGHFADPAALARTLRERVIVPEGFALDFGGEEDAGGGTLVRERTALAGPHLGFAVRHADPVRLVRDERARLFALRAGLLVLAALGALATFVTVRALARERRLAALKSAFVAGVSHDLRTPLASILLMAENLETGRVAEPAARERYFAAIRREAQRLRRLVEDVLDFSRLERGETTRIVREPVDLEALVLELAADSTERVRAAGGELRCDVPAALGVLGEAEVDAFALRRAVWNLVDNALEHSGSTAVTLGCAVEEGALVLRVADRGVGVPPSERERIFEPYERGARASGARGGTGLGLAIVREIARAHGGDARVLPGPDGVGAVFELRVPLARAPSTVHAGARS